MASKSTCDLCDKDAVDRVTLDSKTVLTISRDVCEEHLLLFKKAVQFFTGQVAMPEIIEKEELIAEEESTPSS